MGNGSKGVFHFHFHSRNDKNTEIDNTCRIIVAIVGAAEVVVFVVVILSCDGITLTEQQHSVCHIVYILKCQTHCVTQTAHYGNTSLCSQ